MGDRMMTDLVKLGLESYTKGAVRALSAVKEVIEDFPQLTKKQTLELLDALIADQKQIGKEEIAKREAVLDELTEIAQKDGDYH